MLPSMLPLNTVVSSDAPLLCMLWLHVHNASTCSATTPKESGDPVCGYKKRKEGPCQPRGLAHIHSESGLVGRETCDVILIAFRVPRTVKPVWA